MPVRHLVTHTWATRTGLLLAILWANPPTLAQVNVTQGTNLGIDVSKVDGTLAMDLVGSIWLLPPGGGIAMQLANTTLPANRPRWSPDGGQILYQTSGTGSSNIWLIDVTSGQNRELGANDRQYHYASWHPDGERIVFSAERRDKGLDIWELDLDTGVEWRLSDAPGDETEAAWSADGRHLAYVRHTNKEWALVLRRFGEADVDLLISDAPIASPSWRPDGTLITFLKMTTDGYSLQMMILSEPPIERQLGSSEDYFLSPVSWLDRESLFYTSEGLVKTRNFGEWRDRTIYFRASVGAPDPSPRLSIAENELPLITPPSGKLVIRSSRLFDGLSRGYRNNVDVLIDGGIIESVVPRQDWPDITILDVGNTTLLPGFIDAYSNLPGGSPRKTGPELLSYGVTTIVSTSASTLEAAIWESEQTPGPRLLNAGSLADAMPAGQDGRFYLITVPGEEKAQPEQRAQVIAWQDRGTPVFAENPLIGRRIGAGVLSAANGTAVSPAGNRYEDLSRSDATRAIALVSGLADAGTPGLRALFQSRQAQRYQKDSGIHRRLVFIPNLGSVPTPIVLGSQPNGLPAGLSLHAELRALAASGLSGDQVLKTAGQNAARLLGLEGTIGQITPGAHADLLLVSGDPLKNIADSINIVAVVRNGRFFSLVSLLERARGETSVE